jgi:hypothetical protein
MLMIRLVKLISPYAILFVLSIPGSAFPIPEEISAAMRRMRYEEAHIPTLKGEIKDIKELLNTEKLEDPSIANQMRGWGAESPRRADGALSSSELWSPETLMLVRLREIRKAADEVIENAAIVADYHADAALQIRTRYPSEEVPMNVESHIHASDAARQEVKQLQGTVTEDTAEKTAEENAARADSKATEAKDERFKAEKAARDDAH